MKSNVIFEGTKAIIDSETFEYFKSINRVSKAVLDDKGQWYLLRNGYAYTVIIED